VVASLRLDAKQAGQSKRVLTRYINPASNGGNGTSNALTGPNAAYVSINAAEAALPATLTDAYEFICETDGTADTSSVTVSGVTTTATNLLTIKAVGSFRHAGVWDTSKYLVSAANASVISIATDYATIDGLQVIKTATNANNQASIQGTTASVANALIVSNCILRQSGNSSFIEVGLLSNATNRIIYAWNCVIYGLGGNAVPSNAAVFIGTGNTVALYSSTLNGNYRGFRVNSGGTGVAKNCYATAAQAYASAGTMTLTTCASSDATGSVGLTGIAYSTANFQNVTAGSENLHLVAGSALLNVGTDTSGESAPLNFNTDIDGQARSGTWDIGADELFAGVPIPVALYHLRQQAIS
jgi:hypothetical protein